MGNKQGHDLSPEEKLRLKEEKEREKKLLKEKKERKKREKKEEKRRKKEKKKRKDGIVPGGGEDEEDTESVGGSSAWSEKSVGSASGSWYHSASEPSSKRSSIYLPAVAGPGYYQHDCWYPGYEDSSSEKSKSLSRSSSVKDTLNVRAGSLERYPLGVPKAEPIEPLHKAGSLDLSSVAVKYESDQEQLSADAEVSVTITSRRETNRRSRDRLERTSIDRASSLEKVSLTEHISIDRASPLKKVPLTENVSIDRTSPLKKVPLTEYMHIDRTSPLQKVPLTEHISIEQASPFRKVPLTEHVSTDQTSPLGMVPLTVHATLIDRGTLISSVDHSVEDGSVRGEKRKAILEDREPLPAPEDGFGCDAKRQSLDHGSDRVSVTGSVYYSADEGGSIAGSIYYSATSGSDVEDHGDDIELLGKERPSAPGKPQAVDREGSDLSRLAYIKVENDALLLRWEAPITDGGSPITGYIIERSEGQAEMWVRVNLVPVKDTEYAVANLVGGREYRFRVSAENAVGVSEPSTPSDMVSVSMDQEATEPHFLKELRNAVAVEDQRVEFSVDIIGTPPPDITWFKDGFEVYDTKRFEFLAEGDRYTLVVKEAKLKDEGDIRVRATNRVGVASSQATLTVQAPPQVLLPAQYEQGLIFDTDELIRLRIPYTGRPQPQASWTHNGKHMECGDRRTMDVSDKYATVKIAGASRMDKGMYTLKLVNPQGQDTASFFVTVTDRPDPPSVPTITDVSGTCITLRWDPPLDDGGCRITNYIVEYFRVGWDVWLKAAASRITWTQLADLIVGSEYRFRVKAENAYGVSDPGEESEQILIEDNKSPTGYENLDTNWGRDVQDGETADEGESKVNETNIRREIAAQSGMVLAGVSLKTSQGQCEEELQLKDKRLESLTFRYQSTATAAVESKDSVKLQQPQEDFINSDVTISDMIEEKTLSTRLGMLSHDAVERDDNLKLQGIQEGEMSSLDKASWESTEEILSICLGSLSVDETTTNLLGPVVADPLNPVRSINTIARRAQSGMVTDDVTPAHQVETGKSTVMENNQTAGMDSGSAESCSLGTDFIATVQVYHSRAAPYDSPDDCSFHASDVDDFPLQCAEEKHTNNKTIDLSELMAGRSWTKVLESSPAKLDEEDMCAEATATEVVENLDAVAPSDQLITNLCDEGTTPDRSTTEDGVAAIQSLWRSGGGASTKRAPKSVTDCCAANQLKKDVCGMEAATYHAIGNLSNEGASAIQAVRSSSKERTVTRQLVGDIGNKGAPPDQVVRNINEERGAVNQGITSDQKIPDNEEGKNVNREGTLVRNIREEGTTANQVARNVRKERANDNQAVRSRVEEESPTNEVVRNMSVDGCVPEQGGSSTIHEGAVAGLAVRNSNMESTAYPVVRKVSNEGASVNKIIRKISNERDPASQVLTHISVKGPAGNQEGVAANEVVRNIAKEKSAVKQVVTNTSNEVVEKITEKEAIVNQAAGNPREEGFAADQVARNISHGGTPANRVVRNIREEEATANQIVRLFNEGSGAKLLVGTFSEEGTVKNSSEAEATASLVVRNSSERITANWLVRNSSDEGDSANQVLKHKNEAKATASQVVKNSNEAGATASQVVRNSSEEGDTANQVVRNHSPKEARNNRFSGVKNEAYAAGGQWTARGRMAIANQFRIICSGLAGMTNLGNISAEHATQEETVEDHSDSSFCSESTVQDFKAPEASSDAGNLREDLKNKFELLVNGTTEASQEESFRPEGSSMNALCKERETDLPHQQEFRTRQGALVSHQETSGLADGADDLEFIIRKGTASTWSRTTEDGEAVAMTHEDVCASQMTSMGEDSINDHQEGIEEYDNVTNHQINVTKEAVPHASQQKSVVYSEAAMKTKRNIFTNSGKNKEITSKLTTSVHSSNTKLHTGSASGAVGLQKSKRYDFGRASENPICTDFHTFDYSASWEPKISDMITSRIDLLEGLVYRCLENEDVTMNNFGASDEEGCVTPTPLIPLSRVSSAGRLDTRRRELRDLISELGELVSSMNEKSRTLSADNIAKFYEKTASVVRDHSLSPAGNHEPEAFVENNTSRSSRTHSLCAVDGFLRELPYCSEATGFTAMMQPYDHVCIQSPILDRITYLDNLMNRCLEHDDVTLNTLGSPMVSPYSAPSAELEEERIDASKTELKDLIGSLGSMVAGLGQKFNAHST